MKQFRYIFIALFSVSILTHAQEVISLSNPICTYNYKLQMQGGYMDTVESTYNDDSGLHPIIDRMKEIANMHNNFKVLIATRLGNAMATYQNGYDIVLIDLDFMDYVNRQADTDWGAISIIAHEMGHHYFGHVKGLGGQNQLKKELEADYFSGWMLRQLGASLKSSKKAINYFGTESDSGTHPNKYTRMEYIEQGWKHEK